MARKPPVGVAMEWYSYDNKTRRSRIRFRVQAEHFAFCDHKDILDIYMIDRFNGVVVLKKRHRRSFFSQQILPDAHQFFIIHKNEALTTPASPVPSWCSQLAAKLTVKSH